MGTLKIEVKEIKLKKDANCYEPQTYPEAGAYEITNPTKGDLWQEQCYFLVGKDPTSSNMEMVFTIPKNWLEIEEEKQPEIIENKPNLIDENFALKVISLTLNKNDLKPKISDL